MVDLKGQSGPALYPGSGGGRSEYLHSESSVNWWIPPIHPISVLAHPAKNLLWATTKDKTALPFTVEELRAEASTLVVSIG